MTVESAALPGIKGMRSDVMVALKKAQPATASELARTFGVTANALRRHLKELESQGLVTFARQVRGVGGPVFAYSLTDAGERLFPRSYDLFLSQTLELVRSQLGPQAVVNLLRERWRQIAEQAKPELAHLPLSERTQRLATLLSSLGYMAEASGGDTSTLREHNCTIRAVVDRFPEVCAAEAEFIGEVLGADVTRQTHIAKGANCCEYCIAEPAPLRHGARPAEPHVPTASEGRLQETA